MGSSCRLPLQVGPSHTAARQVQTGSLRCYVDDPHLAMAGPIEAAAWDWGLLLLTWCCFGAQLSWPKGQFSRKVTWIGAELESKLVKGLPDIRCNISQE
eukprot:3934670-Amphidinium_carterae.1